MTDPNAKKMIDPAPQIDWAKVGIASAPQLAVGLLRVAMIGYYTNKTRAALRKDKVGFRDSWHMTSLVGLLAASAYHTVMSAHDAREKYLKTLKDAGISVK
jgi:hypothetical protein